VREAACSDRRDFFDLLADVVVRVAVVVTEVVVTEVDKGQTCSPVTAGC
jgi:hypothetical protein